MNLYRISYYTKGGNYKIEATIHILADSVVLALDVLAKVHLHPEAIREIKLLAEGVDKLD